MVDPWIVVLNRDARCVVIEGSYKSLPRPVSVWCSALSDKIEANPDMFMRLTYHHILIAVRENVASGSQ